MLFQKKRPFIVAFFLCWPLLPLQAQLCSAVGAVKTAYVTKVVDGDTVHFKDGRKIRLVGINTPELDHKNGQHDNYAIEAKMALDGLLNTQIYYQEALDKRDRYGRYLYYLFDKDRISLSSRLLSQGLGYRIAVPPNLDYQDCLAQAEHTARAQQLGVWQQPLQWQPQAGFVIGRVHITSISRNRGGWWLDTNQSVVINIPSYVADLWTASALLQKVNTDVEMRGWQHFRRNRDPKKSQWVWQLKHPNDLQDVYLDIPN